VRDLNEKGGYIFEIFAFQKRPSISLKKNDTSAGRPKVIGNTHGVDDIKQRNTQTVVGKAALLKIPVYLIVLFFL